MTTSAERPVRSARMPRSARRRQLLSAAQEVFTSVGYHAAAMDEIADRAGVSKPVLYQHFPGKLELYLALLDLHADELERRVRAALASTTDNHQRVAASIAAYFDFVDGDGSAGEGAYRLVFESDLRNDPAVRERVERMVSGCVDAIAETIAADTGADLSEARLLSVGLTGLAETTARWWLVSGSDPAERRVAKERAVELIGNLAWRGISGSPRTPHPAP